MPEPEEPVDERVRVPLNGKTIDLALLDAETGGHGLCADDLEVVAVEGSPVTEVELAAAVAAHVAPPPPASVEDQLADALARIETLEQQVAGL